MKKLLSKAVGLAVLLSPGLALAAYNDVTLNSTGVVISVGGVSVSVADANALIEQVEVGASTFTVTFAAGSNITMTAPTLDISSMSVSQPVTTSCSGGVTTLTINSNVAGTAIIRPSSSACGSSTSSGGGGTVVGLISGGGGGGGGGGSLPPLTPAVPVVAPTLTPARGAAPSLASTLFSADLELGDENGDVAALQALLEMNGFLTMPKGTAKGYFGLLTQKAVKAYQKSLGIPATGYVGPKTRVALNGPGSAVPAASAPSASMSAPSSTPSGSFSRDLEIGMTGADVKLLQLFLNARGFVIAESGPGSVGMETERFGALTKAALAKFQKANGINPAAGYFGPKTRVAVNAMMGI